MNRSSKLPKMAYVLAGYGAYHLFLKPAFNLGGSVYNHWFRPRAPLLQTYGKGSYALITGSTSGVGKAVASELSRQGFNLVLLGRSDDLLANTKEEIQRVKPDCKIELRNLDLSSQLLEDYSELERSLRGLDISVVVNNAGVSIAGRLVELQPEVVKPLVTANIGHHVYITKLLLSHLTKRDSKSAIIFTSSTTSTRPYPIISMYSGAKLFQHKFSQKLAQEVPDKIDILSWRPGLIATKMTRIEKTVPLMVISAQEAASSMLDKLGYESVTTGSWKHGVSLTVNSKLLDLLPYSIRERVVINAMKIALKEWKKAQ